MEVRNANYVVYREKKPAKDPDASVNDGTWTYPISILGDLIDIISKA